MISAAKSRLSNDRNWPKADGQHSIDQRLLPTRNRHTVDVDLLTSWLLLEYLGRSSLDSEGIVCQHFGLSAATSLRALWRQHAG